MILKYDQGIVESEEAGELGSYLAAANEELDCNEIIDYADELFERLLEGCENGGIPEFTPVSEISNKIMEKPADIAKLLRVRARATQ